VVERSETGVEWEEALEAGPRVDLERLVDELADVAIAESMPRMEGNQMHTILSRRPQSGGGKTKPAVSAAR